MKDLTRHIELLISRYPVLEESKQDIEKAYSVLEKCYETKHKVLIAGNGGSAADAEHIVGELMKGFKLPRKPDMGFTSKLIEKDEELSKYYYHGIGHYLGLDTHDVGGRGGVLQPGMVITIEPGLYIAEEGIGIRIEDDILVTKDGHENLSKDIIKSVEDIENFMGSQR